jgi:hypothetical protein
MSAPRREPFSDRPVYAFSATPVPGGWEARTDHSWTANVSRPVEKRATLQPQPRARVRSQSAHPRSRTSELSGQAGSSSIWNAGSSSGQRSISSFAAFDLHAIARANEARDEERLQQQQFMRDSQTQPRAVRKARPASAAVSSHYHPLSFAAMQPVLQAKAEADMAETGEAAHCVSHRPTFTFSSPPALYPYRFTRKPDYLLPHMSASLATQRDPPPRVPSRYIEARQQWATTRALTARG